MICSHPYLSVDEEVDGRDYAYAGGRQRGNDQDVSCG